MAVEVVDRLAILVVLHRLHGMGVADYRFLRIDRYARMKELVRRSTTNGLLLFLSAGFG
jgi:hypothetical protein